MIKQLIFLGVLIGIGYVSFAHAAIPVSLRQCQSNQECTAVPGICSSWGAVSRQFENDVRKELELQGMAVDCVGEGRSAEPQVICHQNVCSLPGYDEIPLDSSAAPCAELPSIPPTGDAHLDQIIARLRLPIAFSQREALQDLEKIGNSAIAAYPLLDFLWSSSLHPPDSQCFLGYPGYFQEIIRVLKSIGPQVNVPSYVVDSYANKNQMHSYRPMEEELLEYFYMMGEAAAPVGSIILEDLKQSRSGMGNRKEYIDILKQIPSIRTQLIPVLQGIAQDADDMERAHALDVLNDFNAAPDLGNEVVMLLENPQLNFDVAESVIRRLPQGCPDTARCVDLLAKRTEGGAFTISMAALEALGRFGKDAFPAHPQILRRYYHGTQSGNLDSEAIARETLMAIDPTGDIFIDVLIADCESPFEVRKAVELLERFSGEKAKSLAAQTKARWKI